jgi:hypothetical protein
VVDLGSCPALRGTGGISDDARMSEQSGVGGTSGTGSEEAAVERYSVPQMARHLGISERAVRKQIETGKLFAVKEDRAWVVIVDHGVVPDSTLGGISTEPVVRLRDTSAAPHAVPGSDHRSADTAGTASRAEASTAFSEPSTAHSVVDDNMEPHDELLTVEHAEPRGTDQGRDAVPVPEPAAPSGIAAASVPPVDLAPLVNLVAELSRKNAELTEAATVWQFRARHLEEQLKQLTAGDSAEPEQAEHGAPAPRPEAFASTSAPDTSPSSQALETRSWWRRLLGG